MIRTSSSLWSGAAILVCCSSTEADTHSLSAGIRKLHAGDNIMAVFKINKACQLQICSSNSVLAQRD